MYAKPRKTQLIGLTGGIASGKTTVTDYLEKQGHPVVDGDRLSKAAFDLPATQKKIRLAFGTTDRKELRGIVFLSQQKKKKLEKIIHPLVWSMIEAAVRKIKKMKPPPPLLFIAVPLLFETHSEKRYDKIVNVAASKKNQLERLVKRDRIPKDLAAKILKNQLPTSVKNKKSDFVLSNNGGKTELRKKIRKLLIELKTPQKSKSPSKK